jgi:serralysin
MAQIKPGLPSTGYEVVQRVLDDNKRSGGKTSQYGDPSLNSAEVAQRLNRFGKHWPESNHNGKTELTFEFSTSMPRASEENQQDILEYKVERIVPLTLGQKAFVRKVHQEYADVANVTFTEKAAGASEGHLTYRGYSTGDQATEVAGFAHMPDPKDPAQGTVWMRHLDQTTKFGNWADDDKRQISHEKWRSTLIHEVGHGLGLGHSHAEGEEELEPYYYAEDSNSYTVMSYNVPFLSEAEETVYPASLMMDDMAAIQSVYGANYATRNGDTTYGFNSNTERDQYSLKSAEDKPLFAVWDGRGWDSLDFSEFSQNQTINLNPGSSSDVGGLTGNVSIAQGVTIEEAKGGKGKNILIGNNAFNVLRGGPNSDILFGGSGGAQMWGGKGANTFVFDTSSSGKANWVMDFTSGKDKLDFSGLRQQLGPLNFVSTLPHDHSKAQDPLSPTFITRPGDVLVTYDAAFQRTHFRIDTTGNGKMDMHIDVQGSVAREDVVV